MNRKVKLLRMIAGFSIMFASCSSDELKEIYQGEEITFTTQVSRAVETNLASLESFHVFANSSNNLMFIDNGIANQEDKTKGTYVLEGDAVFWPGKAKSCDFWAFGPEGIVADGNYVINKDEQKLKMITPKENPEEQQDLVVAYEHVEHDGLSGMNVPLKFHHALSQIAITAKCPSTSKSVKIKGVWVVNVNKSGNLSFDSQAGKENNFMKWEPVVADDYTSYKRLWDNSITLDATGKDLLNNTKEGTGHSLMLIPQEIKGLKFEKGMDETQPSKVVPGTYIMLLCRVEATHSGEFHKGESGSSDPEDNDLIKNGDGYHIHQLFPITTKFEDEAYGLTCVSIGDVTWKPGKKYVYNLVFCGHNSGAGVYPPTDHPEVAGSEEMPAGKHSGDPVLDYPITFTVSVEEWSNAFTGDDDKNEGDIPMN